MVNSTDITVGWDQTSYTVPEGVGTFQAFYSLIVPPITEPQAIAHPFFMRVATVVGTAGES